MLVIFRSITLSNGSPAFLLVISTYPLRFSVEPHAPSSASKLNTIIHAKHRHGKLPRRDQQANRTEPQRGQSLRRFASILLVSLVSGHPDKLDSTLLGATFTRIFPNALALPLRVGTASAIRRQPGVPDRCPAQDSHPCSETSWPADYSQPASPRSSGLAVTLPTSTLMIAGLPDAAPRWIAGTIPSGRVPRSPYPSHIDAIFS
mgnify:CR=1 FL=1